MQRDGRRDLGQVAFIAIVQGCLLGEDQPGGDGVDPYLGCPLYRQRAAQVEQAGLGRAVGGSAGGRAGGADAADIDDAAAVGLGLHDAVGLLTEVQRCQQVQADDRFAEARRGAGGFGIGGATGVVD
ncbi:hypothetical protein D3C85_1173750 [compost metagenome]